MSCRAPRARHRRWAVISLLSVASCDVSSAVDLTKTQNTPSKVWVVLESAFQTNDDIIDTWRPGRSLKSATGGMFSFEVSCADGCYILTGSKEITLADASSSVMLSTTSSRAMLGRAVSNYASSSTAVNWRGRLDPELEKVIFAIDADAMFFAAYRDGRLHEWKRRTAPSDPLAGSPYDSFPDNANFPGASASHAYVTGVSVLRTRGLMLLKPVEKGSAGVAFLLSHKIDPFVWTDPCTSELRFLVDDGDAFDRVQSQPGYAV
jgi:hypothetical protein